MPENMNRWELRPTAIVTPLVLMQQPDHGLRKIVLSNYFESTIEDDLIRNRGLCSFLEACQACTNLEELTCGSTYLLSRSLMVSVSSEVVDALGRLIKHTSSLKILRFNVQNGDSLLGLAEALKFNHSLKELSLVEAPVQADMSEFEAFQATLKDHNFTLEKLCIDSWYTRNPGWDGSANAFTYMDGTVCTPCPQQLSRSRPSLAVINFYLKLNQAGRDKLLGTKWEVATTEDWLKAIATKRGDLSVVYYFLRANPSLCLQGHLIKVGKEIHQMQKSLAAWLSEAPGWSHDHQRPQKRQRMDKVLEKASPPVQPTSTATSFVGNPLAAWMVTSTLDAVKQSPEALSPRERVCVAAALRSALAAIEN